MQAPFSSATRLYSPLEPQELAVIVRPFDRSKASMAQIRHNGRRHGNDHRLNPYRPKRFGRLMKRRPSGWMGGQVLFRNRREEISDSLYDDSHRVLRFVHVLAEMTSIPREKMRRLASLCRGEYRPIFLGDRKRAPLAGHIWNKANRSENLRQPANRSRLLPFEV